MDYDGEVPGAGIVSGIGIVAGREVIIHADDASVKGGAWYPLTVKKIVRTLDIAIENRLPVVHLCDSAGGFLPLQAELFADRYLCRAHLPQPGDPVEDGRAAGRDGAGPLHRRRRLHSGAVRLQRDRARHRRDLPRRPAAGEGRDRRGRHRRGARRRRRAHAASPARPTIRQPTRSRRSRSRARSSPSSAAAKSPRSSASSPSRRTTIRRSCTASFRATSRCSSTCAR